MARCPCAPKGGSRTLDYGDADAWARATMVEAAIVHEFTLALERIETSRKERGKQIRSIPVYSGAFRSIPVYSRPFPSQGSCSRPGRSRRNSKVNDDLEWVSGDEVEQDD